MWAEKKRKRPHEWLEGVLGVLGFRVVKGMGIARGGIDALGRDGYP
jgi:hypothetical protein